MWLHYKLCLHTIQNTQLCNTQYTCCIICGRWVYCKLSWEWSDAALVQFLMRRNVDSWGAITGHQGEITNSHLQINIKCNISLITRLSSLDITNSHSDINIYSDIILQGQCNLWWTQSYTDLTPCHQGFIGWNQFVWMFHSQSVALLNVFSLCLFIGLFVASNIRICAMGPHRLSMVAHTRLWT